MSLLLVELLPEIILSREVHESGHLGNVTGCTLSYQPFLLFLDLILIQAVILILSVF